jgi:GTPase SAR1 family protein
LLTLVVYDVTSRPTFDELLRWFRELDTYCGDGVVKVLVGNKVDKVGSLCSILHDGCVTRGVIVRAV